MTGVAFTKTKARAQWLAVKAYREAFEDRRGEWPRAKAFRSDVYDKSRRKCEPQCVWAEDQL